MKSLFGKLTYYQLPKLLTHDVVVDNTFAEKVFSSLGLEVLSPRQASGTKLCARCTNLDFWQDGFTLEDTFPELLERAKECDFCKLLLIACENTGTINQRIHGNILFERINSTIHLVGGSSTPLLSISGSPSK
jgi:hypothetical protein